MTDEPLSLQGQQQAALAMRRRLVITLVAAVVLIGGGWITLWAAGGSSAGAPAPHATAASAASRRPSDDLLETTKSLQVTQQQAVDQLQVVQDQLCAGGSRLSHGARGCLIVVGSMDGRLATINHRDSVISSCHPDPPRASNWPTSPIASMNASSGWSGSQPVRCQSPSGNVSGK
jgi:hypothetical protein